MSGVEELNFSIYSVYSPSKRNNTIELQVIHENYILTEKTNLIFIKQGETGTNGTDIYCKIVPNDASGEYNFIPMVNYNAYSSSYSLNYNRPEGDRKSVV